MLHLLQKKTFLQALIKCPTLASVFATRSFKIAQNLFALATQHARAPKMDSSETEVLQQNKSCVLLAKSTWTMKIPDVTFLPVPIDMAFIPSAPWQQFKHFLHLSTETDLDKGGTNLMSKTETKRGTCNHMPPSPCPCPPHHPHPMQSGLQRICCVRLAVLSRRMIPVLTQLHQHAPGNAHLTWKPLTRDTG